MAELSRRPLVTEGSPLDRLEWPPEVGVVPHYSKPKFGARVLAHVIDLCICGVPTAALFGVFTIWPLPAIWAAPIGGLWALYYGFTKDGRGGQSIGKKLLNLMVVNIKTNRPCTERESFLRQLDLCFLVAIPVVGWLVEPIVMIASKDGRRLGDRAADTQVIDVGEYRRGIDHKFV